MQLRRRLALQGGGFALLLLAAFSGTLYWDIAVQRAEDQRTELRPLAGSAAAQLPLIAHETLEVEGRAKFRAGPRLIPLPALQQQRLQWFDARGACSASREAWWCRLCLRGHLLLQRPAATAFPAGRSGSAGPEA